VQKKGYIVLEDLGNEMPQVKSRPSPKKSPQKAQESPKKSPQKAQESPKKSPEKPRAASPFSQKNVNVLDSIIREFLMAQDLEETCLSYKEIGEQGTRPEAVCHLLSRMLESSVKERTLYKKLIVRLESDIALVEGFRLFSEKIESFLEDFPKVGSFIGELIGSLKASLPFLNTVREDNSLKESGIAGEILGGYLKAVPEAELEKEYVKGFYKEQA